jgi:hypothetical protein
MTQAKLTQSQLKEFRPIMLAKQDGICSLCGQPIEDDPVLDHCHKTGRVRATLHRHCNVIEGKITNWMRSYGKNTDIGDVLANLPDYWNADYSRNPYHPKHKTEAEKKIKKLSSLAKKAKKPETVIKHKQAIKELKKQVERYQF